MSKKQKRNLNKRLSKNNYTELNKQQKIDVLSIIVVGCPHINFQNSGKWLASKYEREGAILDVLTQSMLDHELDGLEKPYSAYGWEFTFVRSNLDKFYQETGMSVLDLISKRLDFEEKELGHQYSILKKYSENTELAA